MSSPVEGKPGVRLVWWCVQHDSSQAVSDQVYDFCQTAAIVEGMERLEPFGAEAGACRVHKFELRQHGYEKIEWGEQ